MAEAEETNEAAGDGWMQGDQLDEWAKRVRARKRLAVKKRRYKRKRRTDEVWL